ncbi:MAG: tetratricopeptide repeat protein [Planctomycetota bacterium]|jgi:outer membrane protein assembly factor BamD (BamD/ComL family)
MQVIEILMLAALTAAPGKLGSDGAPDALPGVDQWLSADGTEAGVDAETPESAGARARLLAAEHSWSAASRAYESIVRRWPGSEGAEAAMLAAAVSAVEAREFERAVALIREMRARWPESRAAAERDMAEVRVGEARLAWAASGQVSAREAAGHVRGAYEVFAAILRRERTGPAVERATLGRARSLYRMGKVRKAIKTLEVFVKEFPGSRRHAAEAWAELAAMRSGQVRGKARESQVLDKGMTEVGYAKSWLEEDGEKSGGDREAIDRTWRAIAARQAELKIDEARLYLRMKRPRAAECVLRSVLRRYGDTPSVARAAKMLEELSGE